MIKHKLNNGLTIVMEQIPTCRSVSFGIWIKTGSRNENKHNNGVSHLIEHMLFKGTDVRNAQKIAETFDGIGGDVNAFTSKEFTCYYAKVLDTHLPIAMEALADMFFNSQLDPHELKKEKNVIYEEIAMYDDTPDDLVHDLISVAAYGDHSLGYSILGTEANLAQMEADDLRTYMSDHYFIDNTVISVAGNINEDVLTLIEYYFGHYAQQGKAALLAPPDFSGKALFRKKETEQNHICIAFPGLAANDPRMCAMILLNNAIGGGMSSRLFQEIREKRGLAYSVYSYHSAHLDSGLFTIYTGAAPKQTADVMKVTIELLHDWVASGMAESELHKGKEQLKGSLILSLESTSSRMNRIGKNELMIGKHDSLDEIIERIEAVSMEQVRTLSEEVLTQPFALAVVGQSDKAIEHFRRDQLVPSCEN